MTHLLARPVACVVSTLMKNKNSRLSLASYVTLHSAQWQYCDLDVKKWLPNERRYSGSSPIDTLEFRGLCVRSPLSGSPAWAFQKTGFMCSPLL